MTLEWKRIHRTMLLYRGAERRRRRKRYWKAILEDLKSEPNYRELETPFGTITYLQHPLYGEPYREKETGQEARPQSPYAFGRPTGQSYLGDQSNSGRHERLHRGHAGEPFQESNEAGTKEELR